MLKAIRLIAERKISEAIQKGQLDVRGWHNKPLPMTNDSLVPEDLLAACEDEHTRVKQIKKLNYLVMKLCAMKGDTVNIESQEEYYRQVVERITVKKKRSG